MPAGRAFCTACGANLGSASSPSDDVAITLRSRPSTASPQPPARTSRLVIDIPDDEVEVLPPDTSTVSRSPFPVPVGGGLPSAPPPTGPPGPPVPTPPSEGPWWSGRRGLYAAAGVFALIAVVAIVATLSLQGKKEQKEQAAKILQGTQEQVADAAQTASEAGRIRRVQAAGRGAQRALADLRTTASDQIARLEDQEVKRAAERQLGAQQTYLEALAELRRLGLRSVQAKGVPVWRSAKQELEQASATFRRTNAELERLEIPGNVTVNVRALTATTGTLDKNIRGWSAQLRKWRTDHKRWRERRDAARRDANAFDSGYAAPVRVVMNDYQQDRLRVDEFAARVDDMATDDALLQAEEFIAQRQRTVDRLISLNTEDTLANAHQGLTQPAERSVDGLRAAQKAIVDADAEGDDAKPTEQPAWQEFRSISREVDGDLNRALGAWENAVRAEKERRATAGVGQEPRRPDVK